MFQVGGLVRLKFSIQGTDFNAGDIVTICDFRYKTFRSPVQEGRDYGKHDAPAPDDGDEYIWGIDKKEAVRDVMYYRSRNSGLEGAPHHPELSVVPNGPPATERLERASMVYLKRPVVVYEGPHFQTARNLTAPIGTRCFIVDNTTRREANAAYQRTPAAGAPVNRYWYIVQAKVFYYRWHSTTCAHRVPGHYLEKISQTETARYNARQLPRSVVGSVQPGETMLTPNGWAGN